MARHGIPEDVRYALRSVSHAFRAWGAPATVTQTVAEGDTIEFADRTLDRLAPARALAFGHGLPRRRARRADRAATT